MLGAPTVYYIWYGNWAADPTAVSILSHLAQSDGGSPYYAINSTYYDSTNTHISNTINFGPSYTDNYSLGKELNDISVETIVANAIAGGHLPSDRNGIYFVLTWQDVQEITGFVTTYCLWHTSALINGVDIKFAFVGNANTQGLAACSTDRFQPQWRSRRRRHGFDRRARTGGIHLRSGPQCMVRQSGQRKRR